MHANLGTLATLDDDGFSDMLARFAAGGPKRVVILAQCQRTL